MDREIAPEILRRRVVRGWAMALVATAATDRDGEVVIRLLDGELSVADSGPGISEGVRSELFNPFFSTKRDGRGLGLTIVQEILSNHGFGFALQNRPDRGAEFRITPADGVSSLAHAR